jgi:cell division protein FtsI (penicillin-binding protein 3)
VSAAVALGRQIPAPWRAPADKAAPQPIERARARLTLALLAFVVVTFLLVLRVAELGAISAKPQAATAVIPAWASPRADIVDRNGTTLARGVELYAIVARPHHIISPPAILAAKLASVLGRSAVHLLPRLVNGPNARSSFLARRVSPALTRAATAIGDPGIEIEAEPSRTYPNQNLASHVVGFTGVDGHGGAGIERALDTSLLVPHAAPVTLAIDARVQQALESELAFAMAKHTATGAAGVVMDVNTGEVVAMASLPSFDPNKPGQATPEQQRNNATLGVYELGSTFKAMTIAMGLDSGLVKMSDRFDARAPIKIDRFVIHDDHPKSRILSVPEVFIYSSNIGTARMADLIGSERQRAYLDRLGFLAPVQVELMERGRTLYPKSWHKVETMTVGFGHGIAVTPLHLATAYATLVNGGIFRPATLLKVTPGSERPGVRVFSAAVSDQMRALLRLVVLKGTGKKAEAPGYRVGGKTGTANHVVAGRYTEHAVVATFAAAFPMDAPRYVVIAMLDGPHGTKDTSGFKTAGMVSAPIVSKLVSRIGPMLGVQPDMHKDVSVEGMLAGDVKAED